MAKNISDTERAGLAAAVGAQPGDAVFFAAGARKQAQELLGATRLEIGRRDGLIDESAWSFVWVVDAPLFESTAETADVAVGSGAWTAVHHAFTSPQDLETFDTDPGSALAWAYDIVCNGNEIGGGSIRIHRADIQQRVFEVMGLSEAEAQEKFGFLLNAFAFGAPPHGGIAFGWDRIAMLLAGEDSIREVIAFPKSGGGYDPLTAAPAPITAAQRKEAGVDVAADRRLPESPVVGPSVLRHRVGGGEVGGGVGQQAAGLLVLPGARPHPVPHRRGCRRRSPGCTAWPRPACRPSPGAAGRRCEPSEGTRSMTSMTRWNRSMSFIITMSNGVEVVPSSLYPRTCRSSVGPAVGQPMDQPRVPVVGEDDRLVGGEQAVVVPVGQPVRVLARGLQLHQIHDVDEPDLQLRRRAR